MPFDETLLVPVETGFDESKLIPIEEDSPSPATQASLPRRALVGATGAALDYMSNIMNPAQSLQNVVRRLVPPAAEPALQRVEQFTRKPLVALQNRLGVDPQTLANAADAASVIFAPQGLETPEDVTEALATPQRAPTIPEKLLAGAQQGVIGGVEALETPENIGLIGGGMALKGAAQKALTTFFTAEMIKSFPEQAREFIQGWNTGDHERVARALAGAGLTSAFIKSGFDHLKGKPNAIQEREAAKVPLGEAPGDSSAVEQRGEAAAPAEETPAAVRSAKEVLTPHEELAQKLANQAEKKVTFKELGANRIAQPNAEGGIDMDRAELARYLEGNTPEQQSALVQDLIDHEVIHGHTTDEAGLDYHNSKTALQRKAAKRSYLGPKGGEISDTNLGKEMLRMDTQRLLNKPTTEILSGKGMEWVTVKFLDAADRTIDAARRALGTKASRNQQRILGEMQQKVNLARQALGMPAKADTGDEGELAPATEDQPFAVNKDRLPEDVKDKPMAEAVKAAMNYGAYWMKDNHPGGLTVFQHDLGSMAKTPEDVAALRWMAEESGRRVDQYKAAGDMNKRMDEAYSQRAEAYEYATGVTLDGKPKWMTFEEQYPGYKPPVPDPSYLAAKGETPPADVEPLSEATKRRWIGLTENEIRTLMEERLQSAKRKREMIAYDKEEAAKETPPAARRKPTPGEGQEEMALPLAPAGTERPTAEQLGATTPEVTPAKLQDALTQHFTEETKPSFAAFAADVQDKFGPMQPGQLKEVWRDGVWNRLMSASGADLQKLRNSLGLHDSVSANIPDARPEAEGNRPLNESERRSLSAKAVQLRREATAMEKKASAAQLRPPGMLDLQWQERETAQQEAENVARQMRAEADKINEQLRTAPIQEKGFGTRENAIARIGEKLIRQSETEPRKMQRSKVTPDDIGWWREKEGIEPAFTEFDPQERPTAERLTSGGAADRSGRKAPPESATKRLVALRDNLTGKVDLASIYRTARGQTYVVDPSNPGTARPHIPWTDLSSRRLSNSKPRYTPVGSVLLDEPVQRFHQRFTPEAWTEFSDAANNEAQRRAESAAEAPALQKEGAQEERPALRTGAALTDAEAGSILDLAESVASADEIIPSLEAKAKSGKLGATDFRVINALDKAVSEFERRNPDLKGTDEAVKRTLDNLYEKSKTSPSYEAFVKDTLKEYGPAPETKRPGKVGPAAAAKTGVAPAAYRKPELAAKFSRIEKGLRALLIRAPIKTDIAGHLDSFINIGNNSARQAGNDIRTESDNPKTRESAIHVIETKGDRDQLNVFAENVKIGWLRANDLAKNGKTVLDRYEGRKWKKAAERMAENIDRAAADWDKRALQQTALRAKEELDKIYEFDKDRGVKLDYRSGYIPGRYEGEVFNDNQITFGDQQLILGRNWRKAKVFDNYSEALKEGYIPVNWDAADLAEHRARQSWREGGKSIWLNSLKTWNDPDSGEPIVADLVKTEVPRPMKEVRNEAGQTEMVESKPDTQVGVPSADYVKFSLGPGKDVVAVRRGYVNLLKALTGEGQISQHPLGEAALWYNGVLKHGVILILDTFHPARLLQYAFGNTNLPGYRKGFHALEYTKEGAQRAADKKLIPQSSVDWANGKVNVRLPGGRSVEMTRRQILQFAQEQGLNVGRIQDALYNESVRKWPVIGALNRFTFDRFTRGLMVEQSIKEFERLNKAFPGLDRQQVMRKVVRDLNRQYGSLGNQGVFTNPTIKEINQLLFLAPQWVEGLFQKEIRAASRAVTGPINMVRNQFVEDAEKRIPFGTIGRGMGRGLAAYFVLTQLANYITRGHSTFQNPEKEHKLDAWIPGGDNGFFVSPLSVFAEVTHDIVRYAMTKPNFADAINQLGANKTSPYSRAAMVVATQRNPQGEKLTSTASIFKEAVSQIIPLAGAAPISVSKLAREVGHAVAPGSVAPNQPGALQRQMIASMAGIKSEPAPSASREIYQMAQKFVEDKGYEAKGWTLQKTDQPSYSKLREAIRSGDEKGAQKIIASLRNVGGEITDKRDQQIRAAMAAHVKRPLTGSKEHEKEFMDMLTPAQERLYDKARDEQEAEYEKFLSVWEKRP